MPLWELIESADEAPYKHYYLHDREKDNPEKPFDMGPSWIATIFNEDMAGHILEVLVAWDEAELKAKNVETWHD